jgi:chaperone required for assembly of F1-ATPase
MRRFYKVASVEADEAGFSIQLDGKPVRTPLRRQLIAPVRSIADEIAAEWNEQGEEISPSAMPMTRLANSALDTVADAPEAVAAETLRYAGSDLICYRAGHPEQLVRRQEEAWNPVLQWADAALGARFILAEGIVFAEQPKPAIEAVARAIDAVERPFGLAALNVMTTLTSSVLLALAMAGGRLSPDEAWVAAHVDEDVQAQAWGVDEEAQTRRENRRVDFMAAARMILAIA